jgi:hypothetical protein
LAAAANGISNPGRIRNGIQPAESGHVRRQLVAVAGHLVGIAGFVGLVLAVVAA